MPLVDVVTVSDLAQVRRMVVALSSSRALYVACEGAATPDADSGSVTTRSHEPKAAMDAPVAAIDGKGAGSGGALRKAQRGGRHRARRRVARGAGHRSATVSQPVRPAILQLRGGGEDSDTVYIVDTQSLGLAAAWTPAFLGDEPVSLAALLEAPAPAVLVSDASVVVPAIRAGFGVKVGGLHDLGVWGELRRIVVDSAATAVTEPARVTLTELCRAADPEGAANLAQCTRDSRRHWCPRYGGSAAAWATQRPLAPEMVAYAASRVMPLPRIFAHLRRDGWADDWMQRNVEAHDRQAAARAAGQHLGREQEAAVRVHGKEIMALGVVAEGERRRLAAHRSTSSVDDVAAIRRNAELRESSRAAERRRARTCEHCARVFRSPAAAQAHAAGVHSGHACTTCGREFAWASELRDHVAEEHAWPCLLCGGRQFDSERARAQHHQRHHEHECDECGGCFTSKGALVAHHKSRHATRCVRCRGLSDAPAAPPRPIGVPRACAKCERTFPSLDAHAAHYRAVHTIPCTVDGCSRLLESREELLEHRDKAHPRCAYCLVGSSGAAGAWTSRDALREHVAHAHELTCPRCPGRVFRTDAQLATHAAQHGPGP